MKLRAVLFDAAGTLIETARPVGEVYAERARAHGVSLSGRASRRRLPAHPRAGAAAAVSRTRRRSGSRSSNADWWRSVVRSTFLAADGTARFRDFDGVLRRPLRALRERRRLARAAGRARGAAALRARGVATGVVSNFDGRLPGILAGLGLAALLDVVMLPGEARAAKPDPRIFALALARLGVAPAAAVFVGDDRARDLEGARAAGLSAIDATGLATLADLPALLLGLEREGTRMSDLEARPDALRFFRERFGLDDRGLAAGPRRRARAPRRPCGRSSSRSPPRIRSRSRKAS